MRVLLDTHLLLWWLSDSARLTDSHRSAIADGANEILISAVTIAEISIKQLLGKLEAPSDLPYLLTEEGFTELPLTSLHSARLAGLPWHHRDPFDRLLIAQAQVEDVPLITVDPQIAKYEVRMLGQARRNAT